MREPFTTLRGIAAPLPWPDVNTDDIAPGPMASPVMRLHGARAFTARENMGRNAFAAHRYFDDGTLRPDFVLNQPPYDTAQILIGGRNFGCGSSRETAVWCLQGIGIRCVIAPSYGEIFRGNCVQNGVLPVQLDPTAVDRLCAQAQAVPSALFEVDLTRCRVVGPDGTAYPFTIDEFQRDGLLRGLAEIDMTLERLDAIRAHEAAFERDRPWLIPRD